MFLDIEISASGVISKISISIFMIFICFCFRSNFSCRFHLYLLQNISQETSVPNNVIHMLHTQTSGLLPVLIFSKVFTENKEENSSFLMR